MIYDGTAWDYSLPLHGVLLDRRRYGHGYRDEVLERKRREAIDWLRAQSRKGWCCDTTVRKT